jgi:chorismate mutase/prephenate dehydratase
MNQYKINKQKDFPKSATVAVQGTAGAFAHQVALKLFETPDTQFKRFFDDVFRAVDSGECKYGILPVENSTAGSVAEVYNLMKKYNFFIVRSYKLPVQHSLLIRKNSSIDDIQQVYSHDQALRQCSEFFQANPHLKAQVYENTAAAAKMISESRADIAAIAHESCAELYNLQVVQKNIQNSSNNFTRFICICKDCEVYPNADRISLQLTLEHKPGTLYRVIKQFNDAGVNLNKLESRPLPDTDFEFAFYFDIEASIDNPSTAQLLENLKAESVELVFLGCYSEINQKN